MSKPSTSNITVAYRQGLNVIPVESALPDREQAVRVRAARIAANLGRLPYLNGQTSDVSPPETDLAVALLMSDCKPALPILPWGELAFNGDVRACCGTISAAEYARDNDLVLVCCTSDALVAMLVKGCKIIAVTDLHQAFGLVQRTDDEVYIQTGPGFSRRPPANTSWDDIKGSKATHDAVAAAREAFTEGRPLLLIGNPGCAKTMVARRLVLDLPFPDKQRLPVARLYSAAGMLQHNVGHPDHPPFRAPHHTCSIPGMVGGGRPCRPGEASLASSGILFLDEAPEFSRVTLDMVRHAYEKQEMLFMHKDKPVATFPARFKLVASMNPCPCGYLGSKTSRRCLCGEADVTAYKTRLDRVFGEDFFTEVQMPHISIRDLMR